MLKSDMVTKVIIFILIFTTSVLANCKDYSSVSNDEIDFIEIKFFKEIKHWLTAILAHTPLRRKIIKL